MRSPDHYVQLAITTLNALWSDPPSALAFAARVTILSELHLSGSVEDSAEASLWSELLLAQAWIRSAPIPSVFAARGQA